MDASVIDRLLDWLMPLFAYWGYLIIFGGVFLESIFLTGWIAPGTTVILLGGFYAAHGELNVWMVWVTALLAALVGDNVGYFIGLKLGKEVVERYDRKPKWRHRMAKSQRFFARYGGLTVVFGRMLSGVDAFIPLTAGMNAMPHWKYMLYDIPGAMLWSGLFVTLGFFFGNNWRSIDKVINAMGWGLLGVVAAAAAVAMLVMRHRRSNQPIA